MPSQEDLSAAASVSIAADGMMPPAEPIQSQPNNPRVEALGPVDQFLELLKNPEFKTIRELMQDAAQRARNAALFLTPDTVGSFLQREQLFGEQRAYLELETQLERRLDALNDILRDQPDNNKQLDKQLLKI